MERNTTNSLHQEQDQLGFKTMYPEENQKFGKKPIVIILISIIIIFVSAGVFYYLFHKSNRTITASSKRQLSVTPNYSSTSQSSQYVSNGQDLNLTFSYPSNWSVSPPSGDNKTDQNITVTSPLASLQDVNNQTVTAEAVVSIRSASANLDELASNSAVAEQNSDQIAYIKPAPDQQQYPYITYIQLNGGTNAGFQEVMITGTQQFTKGELVNETTLGGIDPVIAVTFYKCLSQSCNGSNRTPLSININTWQNNNLCQDVLNIFESLQLH